MCWPYGQHLVTRRALQVAPLDGSTPFQGCWRFTRALLSHVRQQQQGQGQGQALGH